jgi:hypothetical protein
MSFALPQFETLTRAIPRKRRPKRLYAITNNGFVAIRSAWPDHSDERFHEIAITCGMLGIRDQLLVGKLMLSRLVNALAFVNAAPGLFPTSQTMRPNMLYSRVCNADNGLRDGSQGKEKPCD